MALEPIEERRVTRDTGMIWENFEYLVRFNAEPLTGQKVLVTLGRGAVFTSQCVAMIKLSVSQKGDLESPTSCDGFTSTYQFKKSPMHLFPTHNTYSRETSSFSRHSSKSESEEEQWKSLARDVKKGNPRRKIMGMDQGKVPQTHILSNLNHWNL